MSMPAPLAEVVSDFAEVEGQDKLKLLLEFADDLPALPAGLEEAVQHAQRQFQIVRGRQRYAYQLRLRRELLAWTNSALRLPIDAYSVPPR